MAIRYGLKKQLKTYDMIDVFLILAKKVMRVLIFLGLFFLLANCGMPMGNRVDSKNLKVYYQDVVEKDKAIAFATYWRDNGFVGEKEQVIQLDRDEDGLLLVKLIEEEIYHDKKLSIIETSLIQQLERDLKAQIFDEEVLVVVTDNTFRPIER